MHKQWPNEKDKVPHVRTLFIIYDAFDLMCRTEIGT
jgi:hypothetical protein